MEFDAFIDQGWTDHASQPAAVALRLQDQALALVTQPEQLLPLAHLAQHVHGGHLGQWQAGIAFQQRLAALPLCAAGSPAAQALQRHIASLALAGGLGDSRAALGPSDRIRVTALASANLADHDSTRAASLLHEALVEADTAALPDADPALRTLAITGNTLACTMEEKPQRSDPERALMILAAQTARRYWQRAGTWLEVERAEYRLAITWLHAGDPVQARRHAQDCLETVRAQSAPALEQFFAWEALGRVERAAGNGTGHRQALQQMEAAFLALDEADRGWCETSLVALRRDTA